MGFVWLFHRYLLLAWALLLITRSFVYLETHFSFWLNCLGILHNLWWGPWIKLWLHFLSQIIWYFPSRNRCLCGPGFHLNLNSILQCVDILLMILQSWHRLCLVDSICRLLMLWLQRCCFIYTLLWATWLLVSWWWISSLLLLFQSRLQNLRLVILTWSLLLSFIIAICPRDSSSILTWGRLVLLVLYSFIEILDPNIYLTLFLFTVFTTFLIKLHIGWHLFDLILLIVLSFKIDF